MYEEEDEAVELYKTLRCADELPNISETLTVFLEQATNISPFNCYLLYCIIFARM